MWQNMSNCMKVRGLGDLLSAGGTCTLYVFNDFVWGAMVFSKFGCQIGFSGNGYLAHDQQEFPPAPKVSTFLKHTSHRGPLGDPVSKTVELPSNPLVEQAPSYVFAPQKFLAAKIMITIYLGNLVGLTEQSKDALLQRRSKFEKYRSALDQAQHKHRVYT